MLVPIPLVRGNLAPIAFVRHTEVANPWIQGTSSRLSVVPYLEWIEEIGIEKEECWKRVLFSVGKKYRISERTRSIVRISEALDRDCIGQRQVKTSENIAGALKWKAGSIGLPRDSSGTVEATMRTKMQDVYTNSPKV